jgi:drug/metabolite transporter (DMT)-like permease
MNWQIFVAISIVASAVSALLQKVLLRKQVVNPVAFAAGFQLIISLFVGVILLFKGFHLPDLQPIALNLLLMPILYSLGNVAKFQSLRKIEASEFTVIYQASTVITVLIAILFLGEAFKLIQVLGLVLIVAAILLVTLKDRIAIKFSSGELWAFVCAAAYGVAFANDVYILRSFDLWTYTFLAFLIPGLLTLVYLGKDFGSLKHLVAKESAFGFVTSALVYTVAVLTVYGAYQIGRNAAQIASLTPTYSILIVILAAIFLKERDRLPMKLIASVLAVIGIILLT